MINTSKLSKALTFCLVYNVLIILTVICNCTLAAVGNNPGDREEELVSNQDGFQTTKIVGKIDPEQSYVDITKIDITQASDINKSIQFGIEYAIKSIYKKPECDLSPSDYKEFEDEEFNDWVDKSVSPYQLYYNFTFTTYGPKMFRHLRKLFHISQEDYLDSFCNTTSLRSKPNPGASASRFYFTLDNKFIMKSVQSTEFRIFQKMLNKYKDHLEENPASLLPKFSGLYGYQDHRTDIKLVSMNNILPSNIRIHLKYELKGSTYRRKVSTDERQKRMPTFKDLDFTKNFQDGMFLMPKTLSDLLQTIESDCNFLRTLNIMDYSLLMGVHKIGKDTSTCGQAASARWNRLMVDSIGMASIQDDTGTFPDENCPSLKGSIPAQSENGERLLLFVGIIDILQEYRIKKKIEHRLKTITLSKNVSVQNANDYATKLLIFLNKSVFKLLLSPEEREKQSIEQQTIESKSRKRSRKDSTEKTLQNRFI